MDNYMTAREAKDILTFFNHWKIEKAPINSYSYIDSFHTIMIAGTQEQYTEYSCTNNIEILPIPLNCGGMVCFQDDITIGIISTLEYPQLGFLLLTKIKQYLWTQHNIISKIDNNDLLVYHDNQWFKIGSYAITKNNNKLLTGIHISIDMNNNIINQICTKPAEKQPGGLYPLFNITKNDIFSFLEDFLKTL